MTRVVDVLLRLLGLTLVLIGVMGLVLLGTSGTWTARATVPSGATVVLVEPSLASVLGPRVAITATPSGRDGTTAGAPALFIGRGLPADLTTYAGTAGLVRVAGLDGARRLDARPADPSAVGPARPAGPRPPAVGLDLWRQSVSGAGARTLTWQPVVGAQSVIVATADGRALPEIDLTVSWTDRSWVLIPLVVLVLGLVLMAVAWWLGTGRPTGPALARAAARPVPAAPVAGQPTSRMEARRRRRQGSPWRPVTPAVVAVLRRRKPGRSTAPADASPDGSAGPTRKGGPA